MQTLTSHNQTPSQSSPHLNLRGVGDDLLAVLVVADARGRGTVAAADNGSDTVNLVSTSVETYQGALSFLRGRECFRKYDQGSSEHIRNQGAVVTLPRRTTYRTILP